MATTTKEPAIHFIAGGFAGAFGAAVINPLEVVKTRLQSSGNRSSVKYGHLPSYPSSSRSVENGSKPSSSKILFSYANGSSISAASALRSANNQFYQQFVKLAQYSPHKLILNIVEKEGFFALWKGFGTTLIGVFPARAIYFGAYSNAKAFLNTVLIPESTPVHSLSAAFAALFSVFYLGFCCSTITNPLWMIRTRLQLDKMKSDKKLSIKDCIKRVYKELGIKGFYRGVTASYLGIGETMMHFAIYERLKRSSFLRSGHSRGESHRIQISGDEKHRMSTSQFFRYMVCASISRMIAATIGYPHELHLNIFSLFFTVRFFILEVVRTRIREENSKHKGLIKAFRTIMREESWRALYHGLSVHLLRTVPNTAITMATYEALIVLFERLFVDEK
uniref:Mitochondrial carrier protein n=1 Tax=Romanomermis culicivorax TaxID=13658 RepID=A0A915ISR8_ROMCU